MQKQPVVCTTVGHEFVSRGFGFLLCENDATEPLEMAGGFCIEGQPPLIGAGCLQCSVESASLGFDLSRVRKSLKYLFWANRGGNSVLSFLCSYIVFFSCVVTLTLKIFSLKIFADFANLWTICFSS